MTPKIHLLLLAFTVAGMPWHADAAERFASICPSQNFLRYIKIFAEDIAVQRAYTNEPLKNTVLVDAEPEPRSETRWLEMKDIHFPLMPSAADRHSQHLVLRIDKPSPKLRNVRLAGNDADFLISYRFAYQSGCWILISIDDQSL